MPATPRGRGPRPGPGRSSDEDGGERDAEHARLSSPTQLYGAARARRAQARQASAAGDSGPTRQAELFAAARARRARPPESDAAGAVRPAERAGNVWPRGAAPPAPPPPRPASRSGTEPASRSGTEPASRSGTEPASRSGTEPAPRRPATPPAPSARARPQPRPAVVPAERTPARPARPRAPVAEPPPEGPRPASAPPARTPARPVAPERTEPRPKPRPKPRPGAEPAARSRPRAEPAATVAAPDALPPARPSEDSTAVVPAAEVAPEPEPDEPERAAPPRRRPVERPRSGGDERPPRGEKEPFLRRHLAPPSPFGIAVVAVAIALLTGIGGAYVWANNDADRLRLTPPTAPSTIRPAELAPPPEAEPTTTTRPDLEPGGIARTIGPAVWTVNTLNSAGQPVTGSAFVVGSPGGQGLLVTSLAVVEASTRQPGPEVRVVGGGYNGTATLWTWDDGRDLALLTVGRSATPPQWTDESTPLRPGDRLFAVGGGGKVAPGIVTGVTGSALQHNIFIDDALRGGPLVNAKGDVVAVASAAFTGGGKPTDTSFFGVPIRAVCGGVLRCGEAALPPTTVTTRRGAASTTAPG